MVSEKKIRELVEKNKDFLEALEEFDRTGRLPRLTHKERATFTIDMDLMRLFRNYCKKNNFKMSSIVEKLIKEELKIE